MFNSVVSEESYFLQKVRSESILFGKSLPKQLQTLPFTSVCFQCENSLLISCHYTSLYNLIRSEIKLALISEIVGLRPWIIYFAKLIKR